MKVGFDRYDAAVLQVVERDALGRPLVARFVHEEQKVDLREAAAGGVAPEFIVVFANRRTWGAPERKGS